ncbi:MAG: RNA-binding domain-containing protein [Candidatus Nitrosopelagicus sp.]|jgi:hypothetical protein|nr:RNA-binding domain-containing protein [Candidatus Nitrosopelagicus sp.]
MTGSRSCKVQVSCQINPSEDPSKVKTAILNIFPDLEISISDELLIGKSDNTGTLSIISESIHSKNTKNIYQRILKKNSNEDSTWFYLNKQAAFVNTVSLCNESDESPLGPIKVVLEGNDIENIIQSLT